ncbi:PorP/SprF family type IX secretion system membrane protein [Arundinibacter roseus]|uniref:Type IX secretion system membrane protein PorP/SprF n=1 Tax=Arundinibacter roseus TaxID=2070510 RepID=A0A4R4KB92_9BACT|nr:type IX secretion system membrane protein PorP/SprF [Arundinibacter roseus]TDB65134.1 type IX secretion system membrane protein PorP/SprF [Arundinibacter roseus]
MLRSTYTCILLSISLLLSTLVSGQQASQFSQFQLNQLYFNPAAAGADGVSRIQLIHRQQYAGYQGTFDEGGAPSTQFFSASVPLKNLGVGLTVYNDKIGALTNQSIHLAAAYRLTLGEGTLALGASAGLYRMALNYNLLRPNEPGDPLISTGVIAEAHPDINLGIRYETTGYYVGLSVNHLLSSQYQLGSELATNPLIPTYYLNGGVNLEIGYLFEVQPFLLAKYDLSSLSVEGGASVTYNQRFWAGASFRQEDAIIAMGGVNLLADQSMRLSAAYDVVSFGTTAKSPSSYEILLSYRLPAPKMGKKTIVRTPRFRF